VSAAVIVLPAVAPKRATGSDSASRARNGEGDVWRVDGEGGRRDVLVRRDRRQ
jgi:hypothetical protein